MGDAAVVGAGVLGLAVAQRLRERGDNVTVFEASPNLGGLAAAWDTEGIRWDRHYHVIVPTDARTRRLLRAIGLEGELRWVETRSALYSGTDKGLQPLTRPVDFLKLPTLGSIDKTRVAAAVFAGTRRRDATRMEEISARDWLTKWSGRAAFERFWLPLLRAKLGDEWRHASAAFLSATSERLSAARGMKLERSGYVPGGYARIFDCFSELLADSGVKINTGTPVRRVDQTAGGLRLQLEDGEATFDRVVVTLAAPLAADLCPGLTDSEQQRLRSVRYIGALCASVLLSRPVSPYHMTYLADPTAPFSTVVEMTSLIDPTDLDGWNLIYLPRYTAPDDPLFDADDGSIQDLFLPYLRRLHPGARSAEVGAFRVSRVRRVFAVPTVGYSRTMPPTTTSIPGLQLIGSANLPFVTLNVNATLGLVQELR